MRYSSVGFLHIRVRNRACSGSGRLSKGALLSMMGEGAFVPPAMTSPPLSAEKRQKVLDVIAANGGSVNRASVVLGRSASSLRRWLLQWSSATPTTAPEAANPTRRFYDKIKNPWRVTSFDPDKREACTEISTRCGKTRLSFTVPLPFTRLPE